MSCLTSGQYLETYDIWKLGNNRNISNVKGDIA